MNAERTPELTGPGCNEIHTEVRYGETDQMGYAHHATAVLWFEMGRVAWLRQRGLSYRELEASGVLLPVIGMNMRYHAPGRFEDPLAIQTRLLELGKTRVIFENRVLRIGAPGRRTLLVAGSVELACVDRAGKIRRVPGEFQKIWKKFSALWASKRLFEPQRTQRNAEDSSFEFLVQRPRKE